MEPSVKGKKHADNIPTDMFIFAAKQSLKDESDFIVAFRAGSWAYVKAFHNLYGGSSAKQPMAKLFRLLKNEGVIDSAETFIEWFNDPKLGADDMPSLNENAFLEFVA